jgi:hypothetical protein
MTIGTWLGANTEKRMRDDDDYGFDEDDDGEISPPTMRGSANLDPQDYARGPSGRGSSLLDDEIQEDTPSTPGRNPGAASAPDVGGTKDWSIIDAEDGPGMEATTYGAHPWGPGGATGYRPQSMQRTDMELRDTLLRDAHLGDADPTRQAKPMERDDMHNEPEVLETHDDVLVPPARWHGNRNQRPSNEGIPSDLIYDRDSYEYNNSSGDTIGSGVFDMEEGVTWRPRDGVFAHQFALPAYIGDEDEMGIQQSEMFDTTANEWRVVQPSAAGVPLSRTVEKYRPGYSPFVKRAAVPEMRPEVTGPRSHIEAFGRKTANLIVAEAKTQPLTARSQFVANAIEALGPGMAARASATAKKLVDMGYKPETALEDTIAHVVMHATVRDLQGAKRARGKLPNLDRLAGRIQKTKPQMQAAAAKHLGPLTKSTEKLKGDLGALFGSPAALGMGQVSEGSTSIVATPTLLTPRNLLLTAVVGIGGYYAWQNRKKIMRNARKLARKAGLR